MMEAVVIMSDLPEVEDPRSREFDSLTKMLYFKDFSLIPVPITCQAALRSINWKSYGLTLDNILDQGGLCCSKMGELIRGFSYRYHLPLLSRKPSFPPKTRKRPCYKNLLKEVIKLALDDLKEKQAGSLLSENAVKARSHAPDHARTLAGLIMSSNDITFQGECLSLLGLDSDRITCKAVEECIEHKLISVVELHDRKPNSQKAAAPFLFKDEENDCRQIQEYVEGGVRTSDLTEL